MPEGTRFLLAQRGASQHRMDGTATTRAQRYQRVCLSTGSRRTTGETHVK